VALLACLIPIGASATENSALSAFHTPGWAVQCYVVGEEAPPSLICSTPNDGFNIAMGATSRSRHSYSPQEKGYHDYFASRRTLGFGRSWSFGQAPVPFKCTSRATGLTCANRAGHGWWLGRFRGYRTF
jgi:hypothetical protein